VGVTRSGFGCCQTTKQGLVPLPVLCRPVGAGYIADVPWNSEMRHQFSDTPYLETRHGTSLRNADAGHNG